MQYKWFDQEMLWKKEENGAWVSVEPPKPAWADALASVPPVVFVEIWANSDALNDVKRELFWLSESELLSQRDEISQWLEENGFHPLSVLKPRSENLLSERQLEFLLSKGLIHRADVEKEEEEEDEAESAAREEEQETPSSYEEEYSPHRHIQISEGGGMRFRVRH